MKLKTALCLWFFSLFMILYTPCFEAELAKSYRKNDGREKRSFSGALCEPEEGKSNKEQHLH